MHSTAAGTNPEWVTWGLNLFDGGGGPTHDATAGPTNSYESRLGSRYSWVSDSESPSRTSPPRVDASLIHASSPPSSTGSPPKVQPRYSNAAILDPYPSGRESPPRLRSDLMHKGPPLGLESSRDVDGSRDYGSVTGETLSSGRQYNTHTHRSQQTAPVMATPPRWQSSTANDEVIAHALQEEFSHLASLEAQKEYRNLNIEGDGSEERFLAQEWTDANSQPPLSKYELDNGLDRQNCRQMEPRSQDSYQPSAPLLAGQESGSESGTLGDFGLVTSHHTETRGSRRDSTSAGVDDDHTIALVLAEELEAQQEVAKRLHHMDSIPVSELAKQVDAAIDVGDFLISRRNAAYFILHVPKINGVIPTIDAASDDHQRLLERLYLYGLTENKIQGDGNCQFRALSDQLYRTPEHHKVVRKTVVEQLKYQPDIYEGYVPMKYSEYLKKMAKSGEWGDHVTLQAAADHYGVKISLVTSFRDTCFIEITPSQKRSNRVIWLSFWSEVHYNSIYPKGDIPDSVDVKKKKHWLFHF